MIWGETEINTFAQIRLEKRILVTILTESKLVHPTRKIN